MHEEEWKEINNYEGLYAVSNYGRLKRIGLTVNGTKLRILKGTLSAGYNSIHLYKEGKYKHKYVHSLVMEHFVGKRPEGLVVNHIDGNKLNNHVSNLEYVTEGYNNAHAFAIGLKQNSFRKFTDEQVNDMINNYSHLSYSQLANKYNVSMGTIVQIFYGKTYKWITGGKRINKLIRSTSCG